METIKRNKNFLLPVSVIVLLFRLPFISAGYGSEEDAWGLAVTARNTFHTRVYEVSRIPGHPLQELIYALTWNNSPLLFNFMTALFSSVTVFVFGKILIHLNIKNVIPACIALAFTPVYYIASTNTMDYVWALCFILCSFYFILKKRFFLSSLFIALAVGCRITSVIAWIPFAVYLFREIEKEKRAGALLQFFFNSLVLSLLVYLPVLHIYGFSFLNYNNQFGYPPLIKSFFKASVGVWGSIGLAAFIYLSVVTVKSFLKKSFVPGEKNVMLLFFVYLVLFLIIHIKEPHKAAYLIPVLPFLILFFAKYSSKRQLVVFATALVISSFSFGINLADSNRSSIGSALSFRKEINGQQVSFDLLKGALLDDYEKRLQRMAFAKQVVLKAKTELKEKSLIITSYWQNYILMQQDYEGLPSVKFAQYVDELQLLNFKREGYQIYYLPEADKWNDAAYKKIFTAQCGNPLF